MFIPKTNQALESYELDYLSNSFKSRITKCIFNIFGMTPQLQQYTNIITCLKNSVTEHLGRFVDSSIIINFLTMLIKRIRSIHAGVLLLNNKNHRKKTSGLVDYELHVTWNDLIRGSCWSVKLNFICISMWQFFHNSIL